MKEERIRSRALDKLANITKQYSKLDEKTLRKMVDHIPIQIFRKGDHLIEQGQIPLQDSLNQYERGMALIKHCRGILEKAEKRIEKISKEEAAE